MKDNELRGVILQKFYSFRKKDIINIKPENFDPSIPSEDLYRICEQLNDHRLLDGKAIRSKEGLSG